MNVKNGLARSWRDWAVMAIRNAAWFLIFSGVGIVLTGCLVANGDRPPVDPLSWKSWLDWWMADPRSAAAPTITSAIAVLGLLGTVFQIFVSRAGREALRGLLERISFAEDAIRAEFQRVGEATQMEVEQAASEARGAHEVAKRLLSITTELNELPLTRYVPLSDGQIANLRTRMLIAEHNVVQYEDITDFAERTLRWARPLESMT